MSIIDEKFLFSLNVPKHFGETGFNMYEAYLCLQLSQLSYLPIDKQRKHLKKRKFTCFKSFAKDTTYAFMCKKNGTLYIVIRGTDFSSEADIFDNLKIEKVKEGSGKVHIGYKKHLDKVWREIVAAIAKMKFENIIVTGHSMGAGCGQIVNYRLPGTKGYYFGSPRSVDSTIYKNQKSFVYHIQNKYDLVSSLPPRLFGFRLIGQKYDLKYGSLKPASQKLFNMLYVIFYSILFLGIWGCAKLFGVKDKMKNLLLLNHRASGYHKNLEAYIVRETTMLLRYKKKIKNIK
jgi:hypothetical protein